MKASLDRLGVDCIDVYYIHGWDQETPVSETLETLSRLADVGKIAHVGWSNTTGWQLQRIISTAQAEGFVSPVVFQPQYNLLDRHIEWGCFRAAWRQAWEWPLGRHSVADGSPASTNATRFRLVHLRLGEDPNRGVEAYDARYTDRT